MGEYQNDASSGAIETTSFLGCDSHQRLNYHRGDKRKLGKLSARLVEVEMDTNEMLLDHRQQQLHRTTDGQTMMHILKANIGTGVLAMPGAFREVSLWLGLIFVPIIGSFCIHCMNILIDSHNHLCDRYNFESLDYDQVAALAMASGPRWSRRCARMAPLVVTIFLLFTQMGFCCVYVKFTVENLQIALLNLANIDYSTTTYLFVIFPVIGLCSCTSNLTHLARISIVANLLQLTGLALIMYDLLQFHAYSHPMEIQTTTNTSTSTAHLIPSVDSVKVHSWPESWNSLANGLPLFFATSVYAFEGIGVVLPLVKEMQSPAHLSGANGVLNTAMNLVALLYMSIGFFGYSKYGQFVKGSITLNLPESTLNELVRFMFALAIGLSYALQFYVPWTIVWPWIDEGLFYSYRPRDNRDKMHFLNKLEQECADLDQEFDQDQDQEQEQEQEQDHEQEDQQDRGSDADADGHERAASRFAMASCSARSFTSTLATSYQPATITTNQHRQSRRDRLADLAENECEQDGSDDQMQMPDVEWRPPPRSMRGKRKLVRYTVILVAVSFTSRSSFQFPYNNYINKE